MTKLQSALYDRFGIDLYWHSWNNGLRWTTTRYAHYISIGHLQANICRRQGQ